MEKLIIRFDDVHPEFSWSKFQAFQDLSCEYKLSYMMGVIPDNRDASIVFEPSPPDYWERIRSWKKNGWIIAQHGYRHEYQTSNAGNLKRWSRSEFAGLDYELQKYKIKSGKEILERENVWEPVFMAPSHSYDFVTLKILRDLQFTHLTDGDGFYPYFQSGLVSVPQVYAPSRLIHLLPGIYTLCLHVNSMNSTSIGRMINFIRRNRDKIISKNEFFVIEQMRTNKLSNFIGMSLIKSLNVIAKSFK